MGNPFVHIELVSTDVDKAKTFYGKLFNWKLEDVDMGDMIYTLIKVGDGVGGGLMQNPMPDGHSMWISYVKVGNVRKATDKAKALGAKVKRDVTEVKGASLSIITDPTGALLGLWEPKKKKKKKNKS
jgi:predicted enzyme related to lactoylglutathione lyase